MQGVQKSRILDYTGKVLLLTVLNYTFGKMGLSLAVHPGYASILWPPAGVALGLLLAYGGDLWPGVFLASFLLNTAFPDAALTGVTPSSVKIITAVGIAFGSSLQAYVGAVLIRSLFSIPLSLEHPRDAARLLALGGPAICVIAPSVGVTTLWLAGIVPFEGYLENWRIWWLGDTLGVLVFMPLTLVSTGAFGKLFAVRRKGGFFPATAFFTLMIPLCVTIVAWKQATHYTHERARAQFEHIAQECERALLYRMDSYEQSLLSGVGLFAGSGHIRREEWKHFAAAIGIGNNGRSKMKGIQGIGYIANLKPEEVPKFVAQMRKEGAPAFTITPAPQGDEFFIIKFVEPEDINGISLGLNIAYHATRRDAAILSRDTGRAAMTAPITLLQDKSKGPGFILMLPQYRNDMPLDTVEDRRKAHLGWVYAPFMGGDFMYDLTVNQGLDFDLAVYDKEEGRMEDPLFISGHVRPDAAYTVTKDIDIKQQKWSFTWASTRSFEKHAQSNEAMIILISGLLFSGLLGVLLLMQAQRTEVVERMVETRTAELTEREAHLAHVVDRLTESNVELERFAYVVSHDMQEPVRMVANFSSLLWHQYQGKIDPAGQKYLGIIIDGSKRLQAMIADLLEYARVGQGARGREKVDTKVLLQYVLENLNFVIYEHEAQITYDEMPSFEGFPVQFMSLMQNLVNNAIKYQPKGATPVIHIGAKDMGDHILFSVKDNGIGIDTEQFEKIFEPFKRLHSYQDYSGTGLGLSVCKKIVTNHGGKIWVESTPGKGSTFYFTVMK